MINYPPIAPAGAPASAAPSTSTPAIASSSSTPIAPAPATTSSTSSHAPPPKKKRRSKVDSACRFCRRSHMQCSGERPCARCIKREIAHLCTDEPIAGLDPAPAAAAAAAPASPAPPQPAVSVQAPPPSTDGAAGMMNTLGLDMAGSLGGAATGGLGGPAGENALALMGGSLFGEPNAQGSLFDAAQQGQGGPNVYAPVDFNMAMLDLANDGLGAGLGLDMTATGEGEFHGLGLSEFLRSLNDTPFLATDASASTSQPQPPPPPQPPQQQQQQQLGGLPINTDTGLTVPPGTVAAEKDKTRSAGPSLPGSPTNKTERFLLTAADQKDGSRSDRLARVIHAKFEAGLLRPYNHVAGYTRLMKWMSDNMSASSRQRTLHTLSEFRPTFRAIAAGLTDLDLVFIEEAFERLLLDYDRVFSSMGIPSCLWRRTGEIYKGNKEFAALVGVPIEDLQNGKLAIYELMAEESAVNYWEKYGNIAFDVGQKAVLTSCVLVNQSILARRKKREKPGADAAKTSKASGGPPQEALVNACFSFTIRRDAYAIPSTIVGNFIPL
ncbi:hypothetical protein JCM10213_005181 [Rhodosporidiobolus nylandii]